MDSSSDEAQRDRIITHMNRSHPREVTYFLRHYCSLSRAQAAGASLRDVTLQRMRIRAQGVDYDVDFHPPLQSWSEARGRVVSMDAAARKGLGISDIYMDRYHGPSLVDATVAFGTAFFFFCYLAMPWLVDHPGSRTWSFLDAYFPGGAEGFRWVHQVIVLPVAAIHLSENVYLHRSRLRKHGVEPWSTQWWQWIVSNFFEGFLTFKRFDRVIAAKKAEKAAKAH